MVTRELKFILAAALLFLAGAAGWYALSPDPGHPAGRPASHLHSSHSKMTIHEAEAAGYVAAGPGGMFNTGKMESFYQDVHQGRQARLNMAMYTDEGDPLYIDLDYDGTTIGYAFDDSWDSFGGPDKGVRKTACAAIEKRIGPYGENYGTLYTLSKCNDDIGYSYPDKKEYYLLFIAQPDQRQAKEEQQQ